MEVTATAASVGEGEAPLGTGDRNKEDREEKKKSVWFALISSPETWM